jgi:hypothetical protein
MPALPKSWLAHDHWPWFGWPPLDAKLLADPARSAHIQFTFLPMNWRDGGGRFLHQKIAQPKFGRVSWGYKMVIERIFTRHVSDLVFKMLASLQLWYLLCRQRDRERVDGMLRALLEAARYLSTPPV